MKNITVELHLLLYNKVVPFFSFCGGSNVGRIYNSLLIHFVNNVHAKAFSMFGTMQQSSNEKIFF
jgi:hypothetical protein